MRRFCRELLSPPLSEDHIDRLELAATEAASNIIRHAYRGRTDQRVQIEADGFADRIFLRLYYLGEAFDPETVAPPAFDGSRQGGFGVYIVGRSVDEVRYTRDERGRNCIWLKKNR